MESQFLSIDGGNTRLKATLLPSKAEENAGVMPEVRCFDSDDVEGVMEWVEELCAAGRGPECAIAVVGHGNPRLAESLRARLGDERLTVVTSRTELPITLAYTTPLTLGLDRKAAACAAAGLFPGSKVMVVDAGTALTIDIVDGNGVFLGGNISPGLSMRLRALHDFTAALPLVEPSQELPTIGTDTRSAIIAGAEGGWIDEVAANVERGARDGVEYVLLCGGDAGLLNRLLGERLKEKNIDLKILNLPHLVAIGMRMIYRQHEK